MTDIQAAAADELAQAVADVSASASHVEIRSRVVEGNPGAVLLVMGSRGHDGGFAGALPGSVGQHCASRDLPGCHNPELARFWPLRCRRQ
jgi:hypothetical protein